MDIKELNSIPEASLDNFLYLTGTVRGGTTILRNAMGVHDKLLAIPGVTHFMSHVWRYRNKVHPRLIRQIFAMPYFYTPKTLAEPLGEDVKRELFADCYARLGSKDIRKMWSIYPLLWGMHPDCPKKAQSVDFWMEKNNDAYGLEDICKGFPKAKFVFIVRDPRAAVLSMTKVLDIHEGREDDARPSSAIISSAIHWRKMTLTMEYFRRKHPERCVWTTFEEFVSQPVKELNRIFDFCGLGALSEDDLSVRLQNLVYSETASNDNAGKGISTAPLKRWQKKLTPKQVGIIETVAGSGAKRYGYDIPPAGLAERYRLVKHFSNPKAKLITLGKLAALDAFEALVRCYPNPK